MFIFTIYQNYTLALRILSSGFYEIKIADFDIYWKSCNLLIIMPVKGLSFFLFQVVN